MVRHDHRKKTLNHKLKSTKDLRFASVLSFVVGIFLLGFKFYAYHITNSQSIFSDALESIVNVSAALITLIVLILALRPADESHPYGHGKIESMASTFEGGAILFAGILIIIQAIHAFLEKAQTQQIDLGILIIVGAGILNGLLGWFLLARGKRLHSEALQSSGIHLLTDTLTSVGLFFGLLLVKLTGLQWIDPVVAIIFGAVLGIAGIKILIRSGNILIDGHDKETLKILSGLFEKFHRPGIIQIHFTRVIRSGSYHHIDCHMIIPEFWNVLEAHDLSEQFESDVLSEYPVRGEFNIHLDPCRRQFCSQCDLEDCPVRVEDFIRRKVLSFDEITAPMKVST